MALTTAEFFERFADDFGGSQWDDDDERTDVMALIVLDDVPLETINDVLRRNTDFKSCPLWLADSYDRLPDYSGRAAEGTLAPIASDWRSPFIGQSMEEAAAFVRNAPKPPKPLCKTFCAMLKRDRYEQHDELLFVKVNKSELQVIPCVVDHVADVYTGFERDEWEDRLAHWTEEGLGM